MKYNVRITEVRRITVEVEADTMFQAKTIARTKWKDDEYDSDIAETNFRRVSFETLYPDFSRRVAERAEPYH